MGKYVMIYVTVGSLKEARDISTKCLEGGLVACANIFPKMESVYKWQDKIKCEEEVAILLKTAQSKMKDAMKFIKQLHSYDCPCVIVLPLSAGNKGFLNWISSSVGSS